ncbi:hypothetical protein ACJD0Z_05520 [Flavobacteriaceae bacterium M23B6Z8]
MAIRLGNSCANCENLLQDHICMVHGIKVDSHYTCDKFNLKSELANSRDCTTCVRFEREDCANPQKAAPSMMCSVWAPQNANA